MRTRGLAVLLLLLLGAALPAEAGQSAFTARQLDDLSFHQHLGAALPLDTPLIDENGQATRLGAFFGKRPVLLVLDYLRCRTLCGFVLSGLVQSLNHVPLTAGKDFEVITISIDPRDTPADARAAEAKYLAQAARPGGWHFLTGTAANVRRIADVVGFPYRYDPEADQYAHPAGLTIAAPDGTISRYILGLGYVPLDLRLALTEAAKGAISTPATDILLICYCYDPATGRYSAQINNIMRVLGGATVLGLVTMVVRLSRARPRS